MRYRLLRFAVPLALMLATVALPKLVCCEPYRKMTGAPGFVGPGRDNADPHCESVRIGVVAPAKSAAGQRLLKSVLRVAVAANASGGYRGIPFEVVFRADDGPWGMGAKQVAALAYEDSVWAIVGGLDGGAAHLAELVAAKTWVPFVTPTASDLSVDYANVPWVFRCFPTDRDQARALVAYASGLGVDKVLVLHEDTRDGRIGLQRVQAAAAALMSHSPKSHAYSLREPLDTGLMPDLYQAGAVVIWGNGAESVEAALTVRQSGFSGVLLGSSGLIPKALYDPTDTRLDGLIVAGPAMGMAGGSLDPVEAFAGVAAELVVQAIRAAGLNRVRIRDALAGTAFETDVGRIDFDDLGGSGLLPVLLVRHGDRWVGVD